MDDYRGLELLPKQTCNLNSTGEGYNIGTPGKAAKPATDPSYWQVELGYKFGNTGVAASWYQSKDFVAEDSKGTTLGIGARHTLPKANADIYVAMQNYDVEKIRGASSVEKTVYVVGSRVKL